MRSILKIILIILLIILIVFFVIAVLYKGLLLNEEYERHRVLAPFVELMNAHASESEVIAKCDKPSGYITKIKDLNEWAGTYIPQSKMPLTIKSKVMIYSDYPYMIYVFLDSKNNVYYVVLGVNG